MSRCCIKNVLLIVVLATGQLVGMDNRSTLKWPKDSRYAIAVLTRYQLLVVRKDNRSKVTLHEACDYGNESQVKKYINDQSYNLNKRNSFGYTPLYAACSEGYLPIVEQLLATGRVNVNLLRGPIRGDTSFDSPLHVAVCRGHIEVAKLLVSSGALLDMPNEAGGTPLHYAGALGDRDNRINTTKILLEAGANPNLTDEEDRTAFWQACDNGFIEIVKLLLERTL